MVCSDFSNLRFLRPENIIQPIIQPFNPVAVVYGSPCVLCRSNFNKRRQPLLMPP